MKTKVFLKGKIFFISISLLLIIGGLSLSSFRKSYSILSIANTYYTIYYRPGLATFSQEFVELIPSAAEHMAPYKITASTTPNFQSGGTYGVGSIPSLGNGICEIGYKYDADPSVTGGTDKDAIGGVHAEFDIYINSNFSGAASWGNGYNNTYDRATCLRHELGHAAGLGHCGHTTDLMYENYLVNEVKQIGMDERYGYDCIFEGNNCQFDEDNPCGNIEITVEKVINGFHSNLSWVLETEDNQIEGFNILRKNKKSGQYESINSYFIKPDTYNNEYVYALSPEVEKVKSDVYYLEIVYSGQRKILKEFK